MTQEPPDDHNEYDDCCQRCGDEGFIFDCFDGFCADADFGCDDCTKPCPDCGIKTRPLPDDLAEVLTEALKKSA